MSRNHPKLFQGQGHVTCQSQAKDQKIKNRNFLFKCKSRCIFCLYLFSVYFDLKMSASVGSLIYCSDVVTLQKDKYACSIFINDKN